MSKPTRYMGIDPGTSCGYAVLDASGTWMTSGVWDLKPSRHEGGGMRYLRLERYFRELLGTAYEAQHTAVGYEEIRRHAGVDAAHVYGGILATIQRVCEELHVPYLGIPVATAKKQATGKGNAGKEDMLHTAALRWSRDHLKTDDEADALWIAEVLRHSC